MAPDASWRSNLSLANVEVRTRVYERDIFDTHGIIELVLFLEAGRVFDDATDDPVTRLHLVEEFGFRGIVSCSWSATWTLAAAAKARSFSRHQLLF